MKAKPAILARRDRISVVCVTREYFNEHRLRVLPDSYGAPRSSQISCTRIAHLDCGHEFEIPAEGAAPASIACRYCCA